MSFLKKLGIGIADVFKWLASNDGKAVVDGVESTVEIINPGLTGIINIVNRWIAKAATVESIAEAASMNTGTGEQKAAILLAELTPVVLADAKAAELPEPTAADLAIINTAILKILNTLTGAKSAVAPAA